MQTRKLLNKEVKLLKLSELNTTNKILKRDIFKISNEELQEMLKKKMNEYNFGEAIQYIKGFCLLLLKELILINQELILLNNFDLKATKENDLSTKKNIKNRFSLDNPHIDSVLNSNLSKLEQSMSNAKSRQTNSLGISHNNHFENDFYEHNMDEMSMNDSLYRRLKENENKMKDFFLPELSNFDKYLQENESLFDSSVSSQFNMKIKNLRKSIKINQHNIEPIKEEIEGEDYISQSLPFQIKSEVDFEKRVEKLSSQFNKILDLKGSCDNLMKNFINKHHSTNSNMFQNDKHILLDENSQAESKINEPDFINQKKLSKLFSFVGNDTIQKLPKEGMFNGELDPIFQKREIELGLNSKSRQASAMKDIHSGNKNSGIHSSDKDNRIVNEEDIDYFDNQDMTTVMENMNEDFTHTMNLMTDDYDFTMDSEIQNENEVSILDENQNSILKNKIFNSMKRKKKVNK